MIRDAIVQATIDARTRADMRDVMVDIETLGTKPGSVILSIGAVAFHPSHGLGETFHCIVSAESCGRWGLTEDAETVAWWSRQSDEARQVLAEARTTGIELDLALDAFRAFLSANGGGGQVRLWGNGSDFDNVLITAAFQAIGAAPPWRFHNSRCYRTLKSLAPSITMERTGVHHNALDDARSQAEHACRILTFLGVGR